MIVSVLQPYHGYKIEYSQTSDTVLINSNFNCGFYINREALYDILRHKYNIQAIYDPCSYPGIQCKFYYNPAIEIQTGIHEKKDINNMIGVSFMIFRTGSVLIVGMCDENVLYSIYEFLKKLLKEEFNYICQNLISSNGTVKDKQKKVRRKTINIVTENYDTNKVECYGVLDVGSNITEDEFVEEIVAKKSKKNKK
jgi:hypothetical protein